MYSLKTGVILVFAAFAANQLVLAYIVPAAGGTPPIQIQTGFEYLGTAEGKIVVRPIDAADNKFSYQDGLIKCASAGYRMFTVESAAQEAIIYPYAWDWAWIDGVDFQTPDVYFSLNTGKNLTYFNWVRGRSVIGDTERSCIRYSKNSIDGPSMWDVACKDTYYTVYCEIKV